MFFPGNRTLTSVLFECHKSVDAWLYQTRLTFSLAIPCLMNQLWNLECVAKSMTCALVTNKGVCPLVSS